MANRLSRIALLLTLSGTLLASTLEASSSAVPFGKVSPGVLAETEHGRTATFLVVLDSTGDLRGAALLTNKVARGRFVFDTLRAHAVRTQAPVVAMLDRLHAAY